LLRGGHQPGRAVCDGGSNDHGAEKRYPPRNINVHLYKLAKANKKNLAAIGFRDVTQGNNSFTAGFGPTAPFVKGFNATPGYDLASGLGTFDIATFITSFLAP
jgi:hypothetical protein